MYTGQTTIEASKQQALFFPKLIIGGAPKCGTSSLFMWLKDHPQMLGSEPKETFFLMDKDNPLINDRCNYHDHGISRYHSFFSGNSGEDQMPFEATTHYLYQQTALKAIEDLEVPPKVLFLIRKPSRRILSSFEFTKNTLAGFRKALTFDQYVEILLNGRPEHLDEYISRKQSLFVLKKDLLYSTYILYLQKWLKAIGPENLCVLLFEDMVASPVSSMETICQFIDIDPEFYLTYGYDKKNETYSVKHSGLHRLAKSYSRWLPKGNLKKVVKKLYLGAQTAENQKQEDHTQALEALDRYFEPFNQQLADTFNINLERWQ